MTANAYDETRAVARLPHLDVEIVHRRAWDGEAEQLSVTLRGIPSFEAFGQFIESTNPFSFWMGLVQAAWSPWLGLLGAAAPRRIGGPASGTGDSDRPGATRP
jgi:hypothetical protein